jgi:FAD/FMN-containing dehydrogenase
LAAFFFRFQAKLNAANSSIIPIYPQAGGTGPFLAALNGAYGKVMSAAEIVAELNKHS